MKRLITILIVLNSLPFFSQNLELNGGANINSFTDFVRVDEGHNSSTFFSDYGYNFGIGINEVKLDTLIKFRFTLNYINYAGSFNLSGGGMGSGYMNSAIVNKSVISFGIYPLNLKLFKRIDFNFGFEFAHLVHEQYSGTLSGWAMGQGSFNNDIHDKYDHLSAKNYAGLNGRIAWPIQISNQFSIVPQYSVYLGLSNEFDDFSSNVKSVRNYFSVGLQRSITSFKK